MKFQVLEGIHVGNDADGQERIYRKGEYVETTIDLVERFNQPGCAKFERVDIGTKMRDTFDYMSEDELRKFAADEEIDVSAIEDRKALVIALRGAMV